MSGRSVYTTSSNRKAFIGAHVSNGKDERLAPMQMPFEFDDTHALEKDKEKTHIPASN